ncbi:MAG TPA: hypothetical protein DD636_07455 [Anaerolineaceae bacterium]|nr:hypothetical protein [Anaerolineaceae bacterium]
MKASKKFYFFIAILIVLVEFSGVIPSAYAQNPTLDIFVANTASQCSGKTQCFYNDDPDTPQSVALNKALTFARNNNLGGARIHILSAYNIKTDAVTIDFPVNIIGEDSGWLSTSSSSCDEPLLLITSEVTIRNLHLTDGDCNTLSRDLIDIDSNQNVLIENSTLENGKNAIVQRNNLGNLTVRFSEIKNNNGYALLSENNEVTSRLQMTANNIYNNGTEPQVICQSNNNEVNHNYWGDGVSASQATQGCQADNARMLGAQIVSAQTGVQAALQSINTTYPTSDFYGFSAKSDADLQLYVINHGSSMPFPDRSIADMTACGNYFDIFLADENHLASLTLRFSYASNSLCQQAIQTISLCGSGSMKTYPLMWQDVKTGFTAGWDHVGDSPKGDGGDIYPGQVTRCNLQSKNIEVDIDNNGRPNLINDLAFTPFVLGFDITAVVVLRPIEQANGNVMVSWTTSSESNTSSFKIMRSLSETGPYLQVGETIAAFGGSLDGRSYVIEDSDTSPSTTYYYLLQVITDGTTIQQSVGPVRLNTTGPTATIRPTSTTRPTSTRVPTRTPTPFRTATNSFRTFTPTQLTNTVAPPDVILVTDTPSVEPFQKPTNLQSTETKRPTVNPGSLLDKDVDSSGSGDLHLLIIGALIVVGIVVLYLFLTRKLR